MEVRFRGVSVTGGQVVINLIPMASRGALVTSFSSNLVSAHLPCQKHWFESHSEQCEKNWRFSGVSVMGGQVVRAVERLNFIP